MRIFLAVALVTCSVVLGVDGATKNVAIPKPGTACTDKIKFPVKPLKGVKGYAGVVEVFGIPIIAGSKFQNSARLNHVASVMAELLDQDGDGCADDPNVLRHLLMKSKRQISRTKKIFKKFRKAFVLPNTKPATDAATMAIMKKGFDYTLDVDFKQIKLNCTGLKFTPECSDNSIEEIYHFLTDYGYSKAYSKILGLKWQDQSKLTEAMDIARGKRMKWAKKLSDFSKNAWSRYPSSTCNYKCQSTEYLWWGYCSYSGTCAGRSGQGSKWTGSIMNQPDSALNDQEKEFKLLKKTQLAKIDKQLYKLYDASAKKTAVYRLPTKPVDGTYTGCKKCLRKGGKSHGGK